MPTPTIEIDHSNVDDIYKYFDVYLAEERYLKSSVADRNSFNGKHIRYSDDLKDDFIAIGECRKSKAKFIFMLQRWVYIYVPPKLWQNCLIALRQQKFVESQPKVHMLRISRELRVLIDTYTEVSGHNVNELLTQALAIWREDYAKINPEAFKKYTE
ncbi:MAG: hypothetical protein K2Q14_02195 [Gammaproteobacteria bacterium]|nr:hypothetical protein [Gammaproteobacteria bacterium]